MLANGGPPETPGVADEGASETPAAGDGGPSDVPGVADGGCPWRLATLLPLSMLPA